MNCHECVMAGRDRPAVALCTFCSVGLCKDHLVEALADPPTVPAYRCRHEPARRAQARGNIEVGEGKWLRTSA